MKNLLKKVNFRRIKRGSSVEESLLLLAKISLAIGITIIVFNFLANRAKTAANNTGNRIDNFNSQTLQNSSQGNF